MASTALVIAAAVFLALLANVYTASYSASSILCTGVVVPFIYYTTLLYSAHIFSSFSAMHPALPSWCHTVLHIGCVTGKVLIVLHAIVTFSFIALLRVLGLVMSASQKQQAEEWDALHGALLRCLDFPKIDKYNALIKARVVFEKPLSKPSTWSTPKRASKFIDTRKYQCMIVYHNISHVRDRVKKQGVKDLLHGLSPWVLPIRPFCLPWYSGKSWGWWCRFTVEATIGFALQCKEMLEHMLDELFVLTPKGPIRRPRCARPHATPEESLSVHSSSLADHGIPPLSELLVQEAPKTVKPVIRQTISQAAGSPLFPPSRPHGINYFMAVNQWGRRPAAQQHLSFPQWERTQLFSGLLGSPADGAFGSSVNKCQLISKNTLPLGLSQPMSAIIISRRIAAAKADAASQASIASDVVVGTQDDAETDSTYDDPETASTHDEDDTPELGQPQLDSPADTASVGASPEMPTPAEGVSTGLGIKGVLELTSSAITFDNVKGLEIDLDDHHHLLNPLIEDSAHQETIAVSPSTVVAAPPSPAIAQDVVVDSLADALAAAFMDDAGKDAHPPLPTLENRDPSTLPNDWPPIDVSSGSSDASDSEGDASNSSDDDDDEPPRMLPVRPVQHKLLVKVSFVPLAQTNDLDALVDPIPTSPSSTSPDYSGRPAPVPESPAGLEGIEDEDDVSDDDADGEDDWADERSAQALADPSLPMELVASSSVHDHDEPITPANASEIDHQFIDADDIAPSQAQPEDAMEVEDPSRGRWAPSPPSSRGVSPVRGFVEDEHEQNLQPPLPEVNQFAVTQEMDFTSPDEANGMGMDTTDPQDDSATLANSPFTQVNSPVEPRLASPDIDMLAEGPSEPIVDHSTAPADVTPLIIASGSDQWLMSLLDTATDAQLTEAEVALMEQFATPAAQLALESIVAGDYEGMKGWNDVQFQEQAPIGTFTQSLDGAAQFAGPTNFDFSLEASNPLKYQAPFVQPNFSGYGSATLPPQDGVGNMEYYGGAFPLQGQQFGQPQTQLSPNFALEFTPPYEPNPAPYFSGAWVPPQADLAGQMLPMPPADPYFNPGAIMMAQNIAYPTTFSSSLAGWNAMPDPQAAQSYDVATSMGFPSGYDAASMTFGPASGYAIGQTLDPQATGFDPAFAAPIIPSFAASSTSAPMAIRSYSFAPTQSADIAPRAIARVPRRLRGSVTSQLSIPSVQGPTQATMQVEAVAAGALPGPASSAYGFPGPSNEPINGEQLGAVAADAPPTTNEHAVQAAGDGGRRRVRALPQRFIPPPSREALEMRQEELEMNDPVYKELWDALS